MLSESGHALRYLGRKIQHNPSIIPHSVLFCGTASMIANTKSITSAAMSTSSTPLPTAKELGIENVNIQTAAGVKLNKEQEIIVGSVLDLFSGRPSLKKLRLWTDDAVFADPLTNATGRAQYSAQWYGLVSVFSEIERQGYQITGCGNPITMDLKTRYKLKGLGIEQVVNSKVNIHLNQQGRIVKVEDRWDDKIPEGAFAKAWREANSRIVPLMVKVPKDDTEDVTMGNQ